MEDLTQFQRQMLEMVKPQPPAHLTDSQRRVFEKIVSKVKIERAADGAVTRDYSGLTEEEAFAIGETGTPEWPFLPDIVWETLRLSGWDGTRTYPADQRARRLIELERSKMLDRVLAAMQSKTQSENAKHPRKKGLADIIRTLATSPQYEDLAVKELWPQFYGLLDEAQLDPAERTLSNGCPGYVYDDENGGRSRMSFSTFANRVSKHRRKKSR